MALLMVKAEAHHYHSFEDIELSKEVIVQGYEKLPIEVTTSDFEKWEYIEKLK